jgi:hypothetical protein
VRYELCFYIPEDSILHSHRRENLKSYPFLIFIYLWGWSGTKSTITVVIGDLLYQPWMTDGDAWSNWWNERVAGETEVLSFLLIFLATQNVIAIKTSWNTND